ncbi:hypothetical protein [Pinirhizobacter soli]|uniref:hypothetical protein n=1 Tax=Pinirhizobacter soli TaxID=2786953 RepID=UPI00202AB3FB|nr:hypothetical protein [Pinirhizobacter soli]
MVLANADFYRVCNLTENPFRSNATFEDDPRLEIWAGHDREHQQLKKFLLRSRAEQVGNTNLTLLFGGFGTGKSHALLWASRWIRTVEDGGKSLCYYIPTLKKDKGKLSFAGAFQDDLISKTTIVSDVLALRHFLSRAVHQYNAENEGAADQTSDETLQQLIPAVDLFNFARDLFKQETEDQVRAFLAPRGQTDYQAMIVFTRLVNLSVYNIRFKNEIRAFRQAVYLLIDELDILSSASTREVLEINDLIRHLYDLCPNCFGLVLAVSAEQEIIPAIFTEYVLSRVGKQIEFSSFDKSSAVDFSIEVMDASRIDQSAINKGPFPFTREALEALLGHLSTRTPRRVVHLMHQVIEEARLNELQPQNGPITVEQLDESGILDELF